MTPSRPILLLFCYFLGFANGFAQQAPGFVCGFDALKTPAQEKEIEHFEEQLHRHFSEKGKPGVAEKSFAQPLPYVVPVVVHIVHNGGAENIPDAQVVAAIEHLNQAFAAEGYYAGLGATVNTQIQFCMAERTPEGQATTGITRTQSPLTDMVKETHDIAVKDLSRWEPTHYVNIWVVGEISSQSSGPGVTGYAYLPTAHGLPQDGMVCEARYFGVSPEKDAVLIHEMGHYFGLYHTFQGGCGNNDCTINGDRICDTPPDVATHTVCEYNSCTTDVASGSPFASDVNDFTGDFMDYSPFACYHFYTADQALRMQYVVENVRASLLESEGCIDPCTQPITAAFSAVPNPVMAGQQVVFTNNSTDATAYSWSENDVEFSQNQNATRIFNTVGSFPVLLSATNDDPNCSGSATVLVEVQCPLQVSFSPSAAEATAGATLVFTNSTTGTAPLNFEWSVNGQPVSTTTDLSYTFPNAGFYHVLLQVTGPFCSDGINILIKINNPCGQFPDPCPEICNNETDDDEDGLVDCFDTDCACFEADTVCTVPAPPNNFAAQLAWQSTMDDASVSSVPIVANLNPQQDSIPEIIVVPSSFAVSTFNSFKILIFKGDGGNAADPNVLDVPALVEAYPSVHPTVADLDRNGIPEVIFITTDAKVRIFTNFNPDASPCMQEWAVSIQNASSGNTRAYVADFDGDGIGEIFSGNDVFKLNLTNPNTPVLSRVLTGNGASGLLGWSNNSQPAESSTAADLLSVTDCNGDPDCDGLEIAAGNQIYSIDIDDTDGDGFEIKVKRDLNTLDPGHSYRDGYTSVADLNLDGIPEIIVSGRRDIANGLYVWNKNGLVRHFTHSSFNQIHGMVCVANVFDDMTAGFQQNFPELIVCHDSKMLCLNLQKAQSTPAQPFWWTLPVVDQSGLTGASVFDFNGDGEAEIVYRDENNLRIMYGGATPFPPGVSAQRNWFQTVAGSGTFDEYPVVADVDNDGDAEIAVTSFLVSGSMPAGSSYRGRLRIFESANAPWLPARPIWNQYNYYGVNINDDLTVPQTQQKHWLEMGGIGSGKRPFNMHLMQVPSLNPLHTNKLKVPDASVTIDSTHCRADSFEVFLNICNVGSAVLPVETPLAFYNGDPVSTAATLLFPPVPLGVAIEKGACKNILLLIPATYNANIFIVVNDDGSVPTPFNLMTNFPSTSQPECHYDNNIASFSIQHQTLPLDLGPDISLCKNSVVELSAGSGFQRYRWQDGSTDSTFTAYSAGKYWVEVFDACGFGQTDTVTISLNTLDTLDLPDQLSVCEGAIIHLEASGFVNYVWSPADSVSCHNCAAVDILAQKSITILLTASKDECFVSDSVRIQINPLPGVDLSVQNSGCDTLASITTIVTGNAPFVFQWSDFSTSPGLTVLQPGIYSVGVTDENGCAATDSILVSVSASLHISAQSNDPLCANMPTGSIDLTVTGGVAPLQFLWSNNAATEDLTQLTAGLYTVVVTGANGCTATLSEVLTGPPVLVLAVEQTDLTCNNDMAAIDLTPGGGVPPYTFLWSTGETTEDLLVSQPDIYAVTVTDSNGCTITGAAPITSSGTAPVLSLTTDTLTCVHTSGSISATSDLPNTTFLWSGADGFFSTAAAPAIAAGGTYSVTATGPAGGCTSIGTVYVSLDTIPPTVLLPAGLLELPCDPQSLSISAQGSSGGPGFFIQWTASAGGMILNGGNSLVPVIGSPGFYELSIADLSNGCTATDAVEAVEAEPPAGELVADSVRCFGEKNGSVRMVLTYVGKLPVLYSIDSLHFTTDSIFGNLAAGIYRVIVKDANGCTTSATVEVAQPPAIGVDLTGDSIVNGGGTAQLQATVQPLHFIPDQIEWLPDGLPFAEEQLEQSLPLLESTLFTINVSDANGCTASDTWLVRVDRTIRIYIPNVIFPGNPAGTNQTFLIFAGPEVLGIESLDIFDRWGEHVFSNTNFQPNDESEGWTGIFRGKPVAAGVFAWMAKVVLADGRVEVYKGDLTVVR